MSEIRGDCRYTQDHEWIKLLDDGTALVGITDYAQSSLGDVTFVELPAVGDDFSAGDTFGVVESVKAASDLFMPVDGSIEAINEELEGAPELVNNAPFDGAWIIKIKPSDPASIEALLTAEDYGKIVD